MQSILKIIDKINDLSGRILSFFILLLFFLIFLEVIARYFFNSPTIWSSELAQMIFGMYIILSGGHILRWDGHVNMDILYSRLSERNKAVLDIITSIFFFLFCIMLFFFGASLAMESITVMEHSQSAWNPPVYPVKILIPLGALMILMQGFAKLIRDILKVSSGTKHREEAVRSQTT